MTLRRFDSIQEFWHLAEDYLLEHLAEHNLLLSLCQSLLHHPERYPDPPYLVLVEVESQIVAAALRTPPFKLLLSKARDIGALEAIAQDLASEAEQIHGASGLVAEVAAFSRYWQRLTGQSARVVTEMRIHQLTRVNPTATVKGRLRLAEISNCPKGSAQSDRSLLIKWFAAFAAEVGDLVTQDPERAVDSGLKRQTLYLWEDSVPVSLAGGSQFLPSAGRIAPVYTPPEHRRQGYATACVAALSQKLLEDGCDRCFLFTDIHNHTSNRIYRQIGYHPVCDWHDHSFISSDRHNATIAPN